MTFTANDASLPGSPDMVLRDVRAAIFVHGCFWHNHGHLCRDPHPFPRRNVAFWTAKFRRNAARDARATEALLRRGWAVVVVWECETEGRRLDGLLVTRIVESF